MSPIDRVRFLQPAELELVSAARFYELRVVLAVMHLRRHPTYWLDRG